MADIGYPMVAAIVLGSAALAAALAWLTRRLVHFDVLQRHHEVGGAVFLQLGVVFAVLLAFVFSEVWGEYNSAATAMDQECGALNGVVMLSMALPEPARRQLKPALANYVGQVLSSEFPSMLNRTPSGGAEDAFQTLWGAVARLPVQVGVDGATRAQLMSMLTTAHQNRDIRLFQMVRAVPPLLWLLLISFVIVLVGFLLCFGIEYVISHMVFTGLFAGFMAFILMLVQLLDFPFEGALHLTSGAFRETFQKIAAM
jgi:hypothetical protein